MLLNHRQLIGLPVVTRSGEVLGKIAELVVETDNQHIYSYGVRGRGLLWQGAKFLVSRAQVISIDASRMVVDDALVSERVSHGQKQKISPQILPTNS